MNNMERRRFLVLIPALATLGRADTSRAIRGKLGKTSDGAPALESSGKLTILDGDADTIGVLKDARLAAPISRWSARQLPQARSASTRSTNGLSSHTKRASA
jgi:hypothetical protein